MLDYVDETDRWPEHVGGIAFVNMLLSKSEKNMQLELPWVSGYRNHENNFKIYTGGK